MIAVSSKGQSFRSLARYLLVGRDGEDAERVAWTSARNLPTDDPMLAARFMAATAALSDRVQKPVYHLVLSFDPTDQIDRPRMEQIVDRVLHRLGLSDHEAVLVAHRDRAHAHVHVMVNRVHPERGTAWDLSHDYRRIQEVLRQVEREFGLREVPGRLARAPELTSPFDAPRPEVLTPGERRQTQRTDQPLLIERMRSLTDALRRTTSWPEFEATLAQHGLSVHPKGQGLVVTDGVHVIKASRVARDFSKRALEGRFGVAYEHRADGHTIDRAAQSSGPTVDTVARDLRRYHYARGLTAQQYDLTRVATQLRAEQRQVQWHAARLLADGGAPSRSPSPLPVHVLTRRADRAEDALRRLAEERQGLRDVGVLKHAVEVGMRRLLPQELQQLDRLLTPPEVALARSLKSQLRQWIRGDQEHEQGRSR